MVSAREGPGPKGLLSPSYPADLPQGGNREWPWACSPETTLGLGYRLSLAFQVARGWRLLNSVPPSPLSLACTAWVEMLAWLLRVGLGSWGRGSRGSLRTEGGRRLLEEGLEAALLALLENLKEKSS